MQIRFAAKRPSGDHALVLPIAGTARAGLATFGTAKVGIEAAMKRQRFDGEAGTSAEYYLDSDDGRRLLLVGTGKEPKPDSAERLGGAVSAKLLTSGEREAVIDLSGASYDADQAARVALGAMLRGWRHDRYRTRLKDKLRPTLDLITIVGAPDGAEARWTERYAPLADGIMLTRELVAEPANILYPESFVERVRHLTDLGIEMPPVSKVTPLPMNTVGVAPASPPFQLITSSCASRTEPCDTPRSAPMPDLAMSASPSTRISMPSLVK